MSMLGAHRHRLGPQSTDAQCDECLGEAPSAEVQARMADMRSASAAYLDAALSPAGESTPQRQRVL
jgi:hypothetical protein